ncbi:MAG: Fis family transcriptional regulator [Magnetococcales bacterium]|nr:Fis family transcriptional regulator [Magnetococcales bacterium]
MLDRYFTALNGVEPAGLHELVLRQVEEALFTRVLKETRGNQIRAAQMLGINRNTLRKKLRELEIQPKG